MDGVLFVTRCGNNLAQSGLSIGYHKRQLTRIEPKLLISESNKLTIGLMF